MSDVKDDVREKLIEKTVDIHFKLNDILTILNAKDSTGKPVRFTIRVDLL